MTPKNVNFQNFIYSKNYSYFNNCKNTSHEIGFMKVPDFSVLKLFKFYSTEGLHKSLVQ